jgi:hypothetical protein
VLAARPLFLAAPAPMIVHRAHLRCRLVARPNHVSMVTAGASTSKRADNRDVMLLAVINLPLECMQSCNAHDFVRSTVTMPSARVKPPFWPSSFTAIKGSTLGRCRSPDRAHSDPTIWSPRCLFKFVSGVFYPTRSFNLCSSFSASCSACTAAPRLSTPRPGLSAPPGSPHVAYQCQIRKSACAVEQRRAVLGQIDAR